MKAGRVTICRRSMKPTLTARVLVLAAVPGFPLSTRDFKAIIDDIHARKAAVNPSSHFFCRSNQFD
jgi:hypothetical protein